MESLTLPKCLLSLPRSFVRLHFRFFFSASATCFERSERRKKGKETGKERDLRKRRPQAFKSATRRKFFATKSKHVDMARVAFFLSFCTQSVRDAKRNRDPSASLQTTRLVDNLAIQARVNLVRTRSTTNKSAWSDTTRLLDAP